MSLLKKLVFFLCSMNKNLCQLRHTGVSSLYQVITGVGLPVTSHTRLVDWLNTSDTLRDASLSGKSGGTVEVKQDTSGFREKMILYYQYEKPEIIILMVCAKCQDTDPNLPLTLSWYFLSVEPASLAAAHVYSPLSSGETEDRSSSVPSSRMDTPGSLPVSSWPLRNHRITGLGRPEGSRRRCEAPWMRNSI